MKSLTNLLLSLLLILCFSNCKNKEKPKLAKKNELGYSTILKAKFLRPLTNIKYKATTKRLARGKYLVEGPFHCFACHSERNKELPGRPPIVTLKGAGKLMDKTDSTFFYAPNITPDIETGIGNFKDDMIARAIREGVGHDGRALELMPWEDYRTVTDEDIASIVVYLRTIPAVNNKIPKRNLGASREMSLSKNSYPLTEKLDEPDFTDPVSKGKYLASAACIGCHTGWFKRNPGAYGGGFDFFVDNQHIYSRNITSDVTGIGAWSSETFINVIRTGKSGTLSSVMPWVFFKNMTDEDLDAIYQALMNTKPVKHAVANGITPTYCEVCGFKHGLGEMNKKELIKPYKDNIKLPKDLAGAYVNQLYELDTLKISYRKGILILKNFKEWELIPINKNYYFSEGFLAPIKFIRNKNNLVTDVEFNDLGRNRYVKIKN